ncbi:MAG: hypothetical protein MUP13_00775 [Thermoanaerobaculales bacterium]|nr:hypothetical protein [Thermoanaerobaculales bacterium]
MKTNTIRLVLRTAAVVVTLIVCGAVSTLDAQTADQGEAKNNTINVYLWGAGISGDLSFRGGEVPFDVSLEQILDNLKMAAMVTYKRDIGDWSVLLDVIYLNVNGSKDNSVTLPGNNGGSIDGNADLDLKTWVGGLYGGYTFARTEASDHQFIAGVRYLSLSADLNLSVDGPQGSPLAGRSLSASTDLWDGVIGFQGQFDLGGRWRLPYHLDVGTGSSQITYQALVGAAFEFGWGNLSLTYRYLYYDEGNDGVVQKLTLDGPVLAVGFRF